MLFKFMTKRGSETTYFGQIFDALGFPRAGWPRGAAPQVQVQRPREGQPAPVGERRDDQPGGAAQVLVAVGKPGIALGDVAQHLLLIPFILQVSGRKIFKAHVTGAR